MGELLSLVSGILFGSSNVFTRRGVHRAGESFSALPVSITIGIIFIFIALLTSGGLGGLRHLSWLGMASLGAAGILHFVIGRALNYTSLRLIGANRAQPLISFNIVIAIVFGLIFLAETMTFYLAAGILAVFFGVILIGSSAEGFTKGTRLGKPVLLKGVLCGLAAGLCYGISPLLIKIGLRELGSPIAGSLVSHLAAGLVVAIVLVNTRYRSHLVNLKKDALTPMLYGGTALAVGQVLRYIALGLVPINVVIPLTTVDTISVPVLSYFINRKIEVFSPKVLGGTFAIMAGIYIILLFR